MSAPPTRITDPAEAAPAPARPGAAAAPSEPRSLPRLLRDADGATLARTVGSLQRTHGNAATVAAIHRQVVAEEETVAAPLEETGLSGSDASGRYVEIATGLAKEWATLASAEERAKKLAGGALAELKKIGVPEYGIVLKDVGTANGQFDFTTWNMDLGRARFEGDTPPDLAGIARTIYHESRHCEQWFRMARLQAGKGTEAAAIAKAMGIPLRIAEAAYKVPLKGSGTEVTEATTWWESVYGTGRAERAKTLKGLGPSKTAYLKAKADYDRIHKDAAAKQEDKDAALKLKTDTYKTYEEFNAKYRALPEEADAWAIGNVVEAAVKKGAAK